MQNFLFTINLSSLDSSFFMEILELNIVFFIQANFILILILLHKFSILESLLSLKFILKCVKATKELRI